MISYIEYLGHFLNLLYAVAFLIKDMIWLRITIILAASCEIYYSFHIAEKPLEVNIIWCSIWIVVNLFQVIYLIIEKSNLKLSEEEAKIYNLVFPGFSISFFKKLYAKAEWENISADKVIVLKDSIINNLYLIYKGIAKVDLEDNAETYIRDGNFIGEMSYISNRPTTATVYSVTDMNLLKWNKEELKKLLKNHPIIEEGLKSAFNKDLMNKLIKKS